MAVDPQHDKLIALNFVTQYNNESVYLLPGKKYIRAKTTDVPPYCFNKLDFPV